MMFKNIRNFAVNACAFIIFGACVAFGFGSMQLLLPAKEMWVIVCYVDQIDTVEMCKPLEMLRQNTSANGVVKI